MNAPCPHDSGGFWDVDEEEDGGVHYRCNRCLADIPKPRRAAGRALTTPRKSDMKLRVMRNFASGKSHLVNLADEHLSWFQWIGPEFLGTTTPYITICGATIRPPNGHAAIWMQNGPVCKMCTRFAPPDSVVAFFERRALTTPEGN